MSRGKDFDGAFELNDVSASASRFSRAQHHSVSDVSSHSLDILTDQDATGDSTAYTPEEEKVVVRKLDRRLVLFLALLYMLSFLDRSSKCL